MIPSFTSHLQLFPLEVSDRLDLEDIMVSNFVIYERNYVLGKFSFEAFSHRRTVLRRDDHSAFDIPVR